MFWFPSKYKKGIYAEFGDFYSAARYVNPKEKSANTEELKNSLYCGFIEYCLYMCI